MLYWTEAPSLSGHWGYYISQRDEHPLLADTSMSTIWSPIQGWTRKETSSARQMLVAMVLVHYYN